MRYPRACVLKFVIINIRFLHFQVSRFRICILDPEIIYWGMSDLAVKTMQMW
jgi:hypothetical protein